MHILETLLCVVLRMGYAMPMADNNKKNPAAVALGRLGGKKRAAKLSAEELSDQGKRAAAARWANSKLTAKSEGHVQIPDSEKPELVPMPATARMAETAQVRESNVVLSLKEQGYEVGEPALHPDGFTRVAVRSHDVSAWASMGAELVDLAAGRVTLEEIMNRRRSEHRSAAAGGHG